MLKEHTGFNVDEYLAGQAVDFFDIILKQWF